MRLIGYIRVSGEGQKNNLSLPVQADAIRRWSQENGHALLRIEQDVESAAAAESRAGHPSLAVLVRMLKELGYACDSPEFELINEFVNVKGLQKQQVSSSINEPVRIEQYSYRQSTVQIRAA